MLNFSVNKRTRYKLTRGGVLLKQFPNKVKNKLSSCQFVSASFVCYET